MSRFGVRRSFSKWSPILGWARSSTSVQWWVIDQRTANQRGAGGYDMMTPPLGDLGFEAVPLGHLPLVSAILDDLGVSSVLDELLPKDPRSKVSDADCVAAMVLNILGGRTALYCMEQWLKKIPVDIVIGGHCAPSDFSDSRLASTLDHLFAAGTDQVLSGVVKRYLTREDRPKEYSLHQDSTSVALYGAYEGEAPNWSPKPAFGYSKDHRPDLKQLVFGLTLHGAVGLPMVATMFDGNTSDKFMNAFHIESLAALLPDEDKVTLVADSKLVDAQLIGTLLDQEMHFISLVPRTFGARSSALALLAADGDEHPELGRTPARKKSDPDTRYSGRSYDLDFLVSRPGADAAELTKLRFLAVHSEALAAKFEASLPRKLAKEVAAINAALSRANKKPFSCERDAQEALDKLLSRPKLHTITGEIERFEVPGKRQRGRPRTDAVEPQAQERFRLLLGDCLVDEATVEALRRSKSHLVLITDHLDRDTHPDAHILAEYRHQYIVEGHTGFRWLKGPTQIAPVFLKRPERVAGLGLVFILALMVRNYLQFTIRRQLAVKKATLPYYDRKRETATPTAEVVWALFSDLVLLVLTVPGAGVVHRLQGFDDAKKRVLEMLNVDILALTTPKNSPGPSG